ncbi:MAG: sulfatase-like hydrolase/transferase [Halioglobus sp.]
MPDAKEPRGNNTTTTVVVICLLLVVMLGLLITLVREENKPNVVIFIVDDMGFSDVGSYGGEIQTPNIDQLAANGLRFTQAYNSARCWASRASLLTGYYAQSIRRDPVMGDEQVPFGDRPAWARLIPQYLKPRGYRAYHSGKWHLDGQPLDNGFDHSYLNMNELGFFIGINQELDGNALPSVEDNGEFYETIATANYAIEFLKDNEAQYSNDPFFAYIAFNAPHFPIHALMEDIEIYKDRYQEGWDAIRQERLERMRKLGIFTGELSPLDPSTVPSWNLSEEELKAQVAKDEVGRAVPWDSLSHSEQAFQARKMAVHAAMVHRVDIEIGRVLAQLKTMGVLDNTVIFFLSDNGASAEQIVRGRGHDKTAQIGSSKSYLGIGPGWSSASNTPFRLHKSWNHEGGIITPLIVQWPDGINTPGALRTSPVHVIDMLPTVLEDESFRRFAPGIYHRPPGVSLLHRLDQCAGYPALPEYVLNLCHGGLADAQLLPRTTDTT